MSFPRYSAYKDSGVEWLGAVPAHWTTVRLKHLIAEVDDRAGTDSLELLGLSRSLGVLPRSQIEQSASESSDYTKYKVADCGQLVMNKMQAWNGVFGRSPTRGMVSPDYSVFRFLEPGYEQYLESLLRTELIAGVCYTRSRGIGTAFLRLNTGDLLDIRVPLPPRDETEQISRFLDREAAKIDALVAEQGKLIALLQEKRQAVISHAVTKGLDPNVPMKDSGVEWIGEVPAHWRVVPLKYVASVGNGSTPNRDNPDYWTRDGYPWLSSTVVNKDEVSSADEFVTEKALAECHLPKIVPPAVLVGITGQGRTRGMAAVLTIEATINQHVAYVSPAFNVVNVWYLRRYFDMAYERLRFESDGGGSTKGAITCEQIANLRIPLAPPQEQREIAKTIDDLSGHYDSLMGIAKSAIVLLHERRAALISAAVTGQIDVRSAIDEPA